MTVINNMLRKRGLPVLNSVDEYHKVFGFPVIDYYRRVGFDIEKETFAVLAAEYISQYYSDESSAALFPDAIQIITDMQINNIRQVILSASQSEYMLSQMKPFNINAYFDEILGIADIYAESKVGLAKAYIKRAKPAKAVLIGDTAHDREVAGILGVDCILIARGHQSKETLRSCNATVLDNLLDINSIVSLQQLQDKVIV
jgi:phosphoglycolate phosphatase